MSGGGRPSSLSRRVCLNSFNRQAAESSVKNRRPLSLSPILLLAKYVACVCVSVVDEAAAAAASSFRTRSTNFRSRGVCCTGTQPPATPLFLLLFCFCFCFLLSFVCAAKCPPHDKSTKTSPAIQAVGTVQ